MRLVTIWLALLCCTTGLEAQIDQHALAQQLQDGDRAERSRALESARSLGPQNTGTELRAALITLLEKNNRIVAEAKSEDPEFIAHPVAARGIENVELIKMTQQRAAKRLTGAPASQTYRSPAERSRRL